MSEEKASARIAPEFRKGSLTAISVLVGFSLSFLARWAGTPGKWHALDLIAVVLIVAGSALQIFALTLRRWTLHRQRHYLHRHPVLGPAVTRI